MFGMGKARRDFEASMQDEARRREFRAQRLAMLSEFCEPIRNQGGDCFADDRMGGDYRVLAISLDPAELTFANFGQSEPSRPNPNGETIWVTTFQPEQVLAVAMEVDGRMTQSMVSERQNGLGRAAVGGILFGGAGAIVGASTASVRTTGTHRKTEFGALRFAFDCAERPSAFIDFKSNMVACREWYSRAAGFIEKGRRDAGQALGARSKVDRLSDLARLKDAGTISEGEFLSLKAEILGQ